MTFDDSMDDWNVAVGKLVDDDFAVLDGNVSVICEKKLWKRVERKISVNFNRNKIFLILQTMSNKKKNDTSQFQKDVYLK